VAALEAPDGSVGGVQRGLDRGNAAEHPGVSGGAGEQRDEEGEREPPGIYE
jgi:hypothetical protein